MFDKKGKGIIGLGNDFEKIEDHLAENEKILAKCNGSFPNTVFYATNERVIRTIRKKLTYLNYSEIDSLSIVKARMKYILQGIGIIVMGTIAGAVIGELVGILILIALWISGIASLVFSFRGDRYYQFQSPKIPLHWALKAQWRTGNIESDQVKNFVNVFTEQWKTKGGQEVIYKGSRSLRSFAVLIALGILLIFALLIGLFLLLYVAIAKISTGYGVTNKRIYSKQGWFRTIVRDVPVEKIQDTGISQSTLGRFLNFGDVRIIPTEGVQHEIIFKGVSNPNKVREYVVKAIQKSGEE